LDATEPPRIVFENPAECTDGNRVPDALRRALGAMRSSPAGYTLALRVTRIGPRTMRAEGIISGEAEAPIAHRVLYGTDPDCIDLAQAIGVWASLVVDARAAHVDLPGDPTPEAPAPVGEPPYAAAPDSPSGGASTGGGAIRASPTGTEPSLEEVRPLPRDMLLLQGELRSPQRDMLLRRDAGPRYLELGASAFLMGNAGRGAIGGVSPFAFIGVGSDVFLRPALAAGVAGASSASGDGRATWVDGRFDVCFRVTGSYSARAGLQLDTCGGADIGGTWGGGNPLVFAAVGPSVDLRGDLGTNLAVDLRGVFGLNLAHATQSWMDDEVPIWSGRTELAFSWRLQ
jgi:hypothetical protein